MQLQIPRFFHYLSIIQAVCPPHFCSHVPDKYLGILNSVENFGFLQLSFHILTFILLPITIVICKNIYFLLILIAY